MSSAAFLFSPEMARNLYITLGWVVVSPFHCDLASRVNYRACNSILQTDGRHVRGGGKRGGGGVEWEWSWDGNCPIRLVLITIAVRKRVPMRVKDVWGNAFPFRPVSWLSISLSGGCLTRKWLWIVHEKEEGVNMKQQTIWSLLENNWTGI